MVFGVIGCMNVVVLLIGGIKGVSVFFYVGLLLVLVVVSGLNGIYDYVEVVV